MYICSVLVHPTCHPCRVVFVVNNTAGSVVSLQPEDLDIKRSILKAAAFRTWVTEILRRVATCAVMI